MIATIPDARTKRTSRPGQQTQSGGSRSRRRRNVRDAAAAAGFLAPFVILTLVFQYVPLAVLARDSVHQFTLFNPEMAEFVGGQNFVRVFSDPETVQSLIVTGWFMVVFLAVVVPLGLLIAVYLNGRLPARGLVRTMVFLPVVTSSVVVATMWTFMLAQSGLISGLLSSAGVPPINFLTNKDTALAAIVIMCVWQQVGLAAVLFLGGLQAIPADVQEASEIDGAGPVRRLIHVTIPMLSRTTVLVVVMMTVFSLQVFAPAFIMTTGGPEGSTNFVMYHVYRTAFFLQDPGFASAISIVVLVFALTISLIQMRLLKMKWNF
ncbi:carbohydrate ABC transporter permease [Pseudarthrobacter enclensis]|uniref:ABC-type sugar transport system permease subunit n=1 Tax=Pseudarthrobacter enclensis TaxID=993070 RepID=A0ABT9RTV9_9MICC|nr:sugar ABC transporter permease [Pseudarthrobacter enclensis]MDP9888679.1 ABC-type sugar transport system permease subunit [Pseudarthrobacter enclensis]